MLGHYFIMIIKTNSKHFFGTQLRNGRIYLYLNKYRFI